MSRAALLSLRRRRAAAAAAAAVADDLHLAFPRLAAPSLVARSS